MNARERKEGVRILRLVTGELLMGEFTVQPNLENTVFLKDVAQLVEVPPQQQGQPAGLAMIPFMPFTKATEVVELTATNIVINAEPVDELLQQYQQQFNKIITPGKPEIIAPGK